VGKVETLKNDGTYKWHGTKKCRAKCLNGRPCVFKAFLDGYCTQHFVKYFRPAKKE
jgi:hypothetical protein